MKRQDINKLRQALDKRYEIWQQDCARSGQNGDTYNIHLHGTVEGFADALGLITGLDEWMGTIKRTRKVL